MVIPSLAETGICLKSQIRSHCSHPVTSLNITGFKVNKGEIFLAPDLALQRKRTRFQLGYIQACWILCKSRQGRPVILSKTYSSYVLTKNSGKYTKAFMLWQKKFLPVCLNFNIIAIFLIFWHRNGAEHNRIKQGTNN